MMSQSNEPRRTPDAARNQDSNECPSEAAKHTETSAYQAAYYSNEKRRIPGEYVVVFHDGYTLAEHFTFLGLEFNPMYKYNDGHGAVLDKHLFSAVRYDPGVKYIQDNYSGALEKDVSDEDAYFTKGRLINATSVLPFD